MLFHLSDDAELFEKLDEFSALLPLENSLGRLKCLVKAPNRALGKLFRRLHEINQ